MQNAKYCFRMSGLFFLSNYLNLLEVSNLSWICQAHRAEPGRMMDNRLQILTTKDKTKTKREKKNEMNFLLSNFLLLKCEWADRRRRFQAASFN